MGDFTVKVTGFSSNGQVQDNQGEARPDGLAAWWSEQHKGYVGDWGKRPNVFEVNPQLAEASIYDLLDSAGAGFEALKVPTHIYNPHTGIYVASEKTFSVVRTDTWDEVGPRCGPDYTVIQYAEALEAVIGDLRQIGGIPTRVIGLNGGSQVVIQCALPETFWVNGSQHGLFLNLWASHDGTKAVGGNSTDFRVVCANTYAMAKGSLLNRFFSKHTKNVKSRLTELARLVGILRQDYVEYGKQLFTLAEKEVNSEEINQFLLALVPEPEKAEAVRQNAQRANRRQEIASVILRGAASNGKVTAYDLFQGVTGYVDRREQNRDSGSQWEYATVGQGQNLKDAAWNILTA